MKIQSLAIIAIIIILPMSILLTEYTQNQIKTIKTQVQYDSKLDNATYDAIKAFQLNMSNSSTSDLADSKMRDIKASINVFYSSLASNLNMSGYGKEVLHNYVPAVVYTLYDGYYIYSSFDNKLDVKRINDEDSDKVQRDTFDDNATYKDGENLFGLKPYVYYSCRYKKSNPDIDVVITYSLDTYITVQGSINRKPVNESGYLLTGVNRIGSEGDYKYTYNGIEIKAESSLKHNIYVEKDDTGDEAKNNLIKIDGTIAGSIKYYPYKRVNGVYYYKEDSGDIISIINDKKFTQFTGDDAANINFDENTAAVQFYKDAYDFKEMLISGKLKELMNLKVNDAVDAQGNPKYNNEGNNNNYIFNALNSTNSYIEDKNSEFNNHKLQVIRDAIETNLIPAISNYNKVSTSDVNFQMPKLNDEEWEQICNNVSMISFLQGLNIGGKIYNGHSIIINSNNEDFISDDSIYILANENSQNKYHRITEKDLETIIDLNSKGILNLDVEQRASNATIGSGSNEKSKIIYYYPREELASYKFNSGSSIATSNTLEYVRRQLAESSDINKKYLAELYYIALGRERYGMYRVANKLEKVQEFIRKKLIDTY